MQRNSYCSLKAPSEIPRFLLPLRFQISGILAHCPRSRVGFGPQFAARMASRSSDLTLKLTNHLCHRSLLLGRSQTSSLVNLIPDNYVRLHFAETGHTTQSNPILRSQTQLRIRISPDFRRAQICGGSVTISFLQIWYHRLVQRRTLREYFRFTAPRSKSRRTDLVPQRFTNGIPACQTER
jgi:hypothetical protein